MARFRFRLEQVLRVRKHEEEGKKGLFAAAVQARTLAELQLADVRRRLEEANTSASALTAKGSTLDTLVQSYEYRMALRRAEADSVTAVSRMVARWEHARKELVEARKKRRALELLREHHHEKWKKEEENKEQDELDEFALGGFIRAEKREELNL